MHKILWDTDGPIFLFSLWSLDNRHGVSISIGNITYECEWHQIATIHNTMICDAQNTLVILTDLFSCFRCEIRLASKIHARLPRCFMSIFLLKSDGGTLQNIHFNAFVIVMCYIHRENNIWFKLNHKILSSHSPSGRCFSIYWCVQDRQGQTVLQSPRPVHCPWHGLLWSILTCMHEVR